MTLRAGLALLALAAIAALGGCGEDRVKEIESVRTEIEIGNGKLADAFAKRDVAGLGALYTADAQAYPPGVPPVAGRSAVEDMWKGYLAMPVGRIQLRTVEVDGNGSTAWETGTYTIVGSNGATLDDGKRIVVWKREPDGWKVYRHMWSSNTPQAIRTVPP